MQTNEPNGHGHGPRVLALGINGFAEGARRLAEKMHTGTKPGATPEEQAAAETAAHAFLRHAPAAMRSIARLELIAEDITKTATGRRDEIMTSIFGPDTT